MRIFKIILYVVTGLVLVAVAAVAALVFVDPTAYRNQIETKASAAFGRECKIAGPIHLERSLRPRIIVEDVSIGNPDWARGTHFATAEKVGIQVALFPLLRGNLRILDVSFSGVDLFIEEGPDGANNYTFGSDNESETTGILPAVERLQVNDSVINYKRADGSSKHFKIIAARLWNIPGEPERIEARGSIKEMAFTIRLAADSAAELSGPQNPWSLKLDIEGSDMLLNLAGRMGEAFKWERGEYLIKLSGDQADSLETLFDVELPTSGPFELSRPPPGGTENTCDHNFGWRGLRRAGRTASPGLAGSVRRGAIQAQIRIVAAARGHFAKNTLAVRGRAYPCGPKTEHQK